MIIEILPCEEKSNVLYECYVKDTLFCDVSVSLKNPNELFYDFLHENKTVVAKTKSAGKLSKIFRKQDVILLFEKERPIGCIQGLISDGCLEITYREMSYTASLTLFENAYYIVLLAEAGRVAAELKGTTNNKSSKISYAAFTRRENMEELLCILASIGERYSKKADTLPACYDENYIKFVCIKEESL